MGIMWGEVASSALERVGENVSADLERARSRRQAIIDASVQDMFTSGKEAFAKRKLEREGIQDNIQYFQSMGFDRDTIEQLVSLSSTEIDKIKLSLDDGRKAASLEEKPDQSQLEYDPYSILPNRTDPRNLESAEIFVENISPAARTEAINALPLGERDRLLQKAKGLGIVIMDTNKSLEENKAMAKEAILKVQRMEQVEESQTSDYDTWEDSVLANIIGKIDHSKFPDSKAEKSFGDNFRTSLRDNFGWAGGEQEEALRQAALLFPGKSAAELKAVLDPTLAADMGGYERPETIAPLEYEIGYTELEQRQLKTAAVNLDKATLELDILTDAKAQDDQLISALRIEIGNDKYGTIDGELVSGDLTVGKFRQLKKLEIEDMEGLFSKRRMEQQLMAPTGTQSRLLRNALATANTITGAKIQSDEYGRYLLGTGKPEAELIAREASDNASTLVNNFDWKGNETIFSSPTNDLTRDITIWLMYSNLRNVAAGDNPEDKRRAVQNLVTSDFANLQQGWAKENADLSFANHIKTENPAAVSLIKNNIEKLMKLDKDVEGSKQKGIHTLLTNATEVLEANMELKVGDRKSTSYFGGLGGFSETVEPPETLEPEKATEDEMQSEMDITDVEVNEILSGGIKEITNKIRENSRLDAFITSKYPTLDRGELHKHLVTVHRQIEAKDLMRIIRLFAERNTERPA